MRFSHRRVAFLDVGAESLEGSSVAVSVEEALHRHLCICVYVHCVRVTMCTWVQVCMRGVEEAFCIATSSTLNSSRSLFLMTMCVPALTMPSSAQARASHACSCMAMHAHACLRPCMPTPMHAYAHACPCMPMAMHVTCLP